MRITAELQPIASLRAEGRAVRDENLVITTQNVRRFHLTDDAPNTITRTIDGTDSLPSKWGRHFLREVEGGGWVVVAGAVETGPFYDDVDLGKAEKRPSFTGPFKNAFLDAFVLVYPTQGTEEENLTSLERARYDAQVWWYRANGNARLVADVDMYTKPMEAWSGTYDWGTPILYGNADTNSVWRRVFGDDPPIDVRRGVVQVGDDRFEGDDLGCVMVRSDRYGLGLAGAIASTGVPGDRVGYTLAYFVSGVGYPDYAAFSSRVLTEGDGGVLAAGWFDHAWKLDGFGYRDEHAPELRARSPSGR